MGPGLFARNRPGTTVTEAPSAKRNTEAAEAYVARQKPSDPVDFLQRAALIMGFSLNPGTLTPRTVPSPGNMIPGENPSREIPFRGENPAPGNTLPGENPAPGIMLPGENQAPGNTLPGDNPAPGNTLNPGNYPAPGINPGNGLGLDPPPGSAYPSLSFPAGYVLAPALNQGSRPTAPAALGAPPGEESFLGPGPQPADFDKTESSVSGSVFTVDDPDTNAAEQQIGDKAQSLLRKYSPQFYGTGQGDGSQAEPSVSLLFGPARTPPRAFLLRTISSRNMPALPGNPGSERQVRYADPTDSSRRISTNSYPRSPYPRKSSAWRIGNPAETRLKGKHTRKLTRNGPKFRSSPVRPCACRPIPGP